ncbi:hypothetical protein LIER_00715 [Lithospermum erythrorhizon]|uniref:TLC domain-containing protein n=1 Tax=Lithospermum erythrorhizon TaxID=34254 RepID=A0AAV3NM19_LITER
METLTLISTTIPNIPLFFSLYFIIYVIAYLIIFKNWSPKLRPEASSCAISLIHGTPAVFLASKAIFVDPNFNFDSPNTIFQNLVLDYSISYFFMDLFHYLVFYPSDVLFILHHLATLFVFLTCRFVVFHGGCALLVLLILAEVTSFCQNAWTLASARRNDLEFAAKLYDYLSPPFYALYSVVRGCVGPAFVFKMLMFYVSGAAHNVVPKWAWISWVFVVFTAISVSILWVVNRWIDYFRERNRKIQKKVR